jgi:transposase, IS30 family
MGTSYKHLNQVQRGRIKALLDDGYSHHKIARVIGLKNHSTVSREVARNGYGNDGRTPADKQRVYNSTRAQHKAYVRRKYAKYQGKKIQEHDELRAFVKDKLKAHWNPDEISGYLKVNPSFGFYASKTAIYEWLRSEWGQDYCVCLYSQRKRVKKRRPKAKKQMIPDRISIEQRPQEANERAAAGHWEQDAIVGKKGGSKACLSVKQERVSRLLAAIILPSLSPKLHVDSSQILSQGALIKSITFDNGLENREHGQLGAQGIETYFTDPYSSWQKGGVENGNKMLRRYFPKGTDFANVSQAEVNYALDLINQKPRKILGYKSAVQLAVEKGVITVTSGALRG